MYAAQLIFLTINLLKALCPLLVEKHCKIRNSLLIFPLCLVYSRIDCFTSYFPTLDFFSLLVHQELVQKFFQRAKQVIFTNYIFGHQIFMLFEKKKLYIYFFHFTFAWPDYSFLYYLRVANECLNNFPCSKGNAASK